MPGKGKPFKPGNTTGKLGGRPPIPEDLKEISLISTDTVKRLIARYVEMNKAQLQQAAQDPSTPMLEMMIASVIVKATKDGDYSRIDFLLNRLIGKVTEKMEVKLPTPFIVKRSDGSEVVMGAKVEKEEE